MTKRGMTSRNVVIAGFLTVLGLAILLLPLLTSSAGETPIPSAGAKHGNTAQAGQDDRSKEITTKLEAIQQLLERQNVELIEQRRQINAILSHLTFAPEVGVHQDYAQARSQFRTKLVRKGPSPQEWSPTKPSAGATEVEYPSGDLRLKAWLHRPADQTRKHPAVLWLHGGFAFDFPDDWDVTKPYRDAGFVVLAPTLRGENGQPGSFTYFYDEVDDVLAAAEYLGKQPFVDPDRMYVAGHSVGGTMTLLAVMASKRFRAAAAFSACPDQIGGFRETTGLPFDKGDPRELQLRSPMAYATSFKCPLRIYSGTKEITFHLMSMRTAALAKGQGLDVEALQIEGNHTTMVLPATKQSIAFFLRNPIQEGVAAREIAPLPKTLELDLGDGIKMKLARIEPGKFLMGSSPNELERRDDELQHEVSITKAYCMGVYLVTQAQYRQVMGTNPSMFSPRGRLKDKVAGHATDDFPVESVSWDDAMDFCRMVSLLPAVKEKGWVIDLPTEAEWEFACRAGTNTEFYYGNSLSSIQANFNGKSPYGGAAKGPFLGRSTKVGSYAANAWGLFDMHGNVNQWCKDWYDKDYYQNSEKHDPVGPKDGRSRVMRGGPWYAAAGLCRAASRNPNEPESRQPHRGFRVVVRLSAR
ncbi:MAG TPA: SUMF1/EgtB/PvdO family nonheme iron enzyme, partial [Gemmataceae bacterium]|nr:SUMF1/EgtB/PvdO family nonheme iron enzyme [Gemmataceae bacterium]